MQLRLATEKVKEFRRLGGDDLPLVEQILCGDTRAFEELVRRHERRVFRVALAVTGNQQDAEEAMHDTFVKAYRRLADFRRESRFTTWLTRIAVNEALQLRRAIATHIATCHCCRVVVDTIEETLQIISGTAPFEVPLAASARLYKRLRTL